MISSSRSRLSYKDRRSHQKQRFRSVSVIVLVLVIYLFITVLLAEAWKMETQAMSPGYPPGVRFLVNNYLFRNSDGRPLRVPSRGDIVAIYPPYIPESSWFLGVINPVIRLFTLQKASLGIHVKNEWEHERIFKRIVAVPGDTIRMEGSVAYIRSAESEFFISEFEQSGKGYDLVIPEHPANWNTGFPLSDTMEPLSLGEHQYFVLGDDRSASNDSRYWGPVDERAIRGRVFFVYWPLGEFGPPR